MTRQEHLKWAQDNALEYCERNDLVNALASLASDLAKHPDTQGHPAIELGMKLFMAGHLNTSETMRRFILGFH